MSSTANNEAAGIRTVLVDARALQDERFRDRGIGLHAASVLEGAAAAGADIRLIAAVDRGLPRLSAAYRGLFVDERSIGAPPPAGTLFVQPSPMTHSPRPVQRILEEPRVRSVAIVHDFIPFDDPTRYLRDPRERADYLDRLASLGDYDVFVSNSTHTAGRLADLLEVSPRRSFVSGVAVRPTVVSHPSTASGGDPYLLTVVGGDPRKNVDLPIRAHAGSRLLQDRDIRLKIVGNYDEPGKDRIRRWCVEAGGRADLVELIADITDAELGILYRNALATVCPSRSEGFSIPIVEANANGCPVLVSACPAQTELVPWPEFQFDPDDAERLRGLMEAFADPRVGDVALAKQGQFWARFEAGAVQARFWRAALGETTDLAEAGIAGAPFVLRGARPRIAIASPVPPDHSGVADFTLATMTALSRRAEIDLYTETQGRIASPAFASIRPLSAEPYVRRNHDALLSVVGNSHLHLGTFNLLLEHGGAAIAHDSRMLHFYCGMLGRERTLAVAEHECRAPVSWDDVEGWLRDQQRMPILFLSEILEAAEPTIVHSRLSQALIRDRYGIEPGFVPFAVQRLPSREFAGIDGRRRARALLGYQEDVPLLISMGDLTEDKGLEECIWTVAMLSGWGVTAHLALVGGGPPHVADRLRALARDAGVEGRVHIAGHSVDERSYQAHIAAADAAIQFRTYRFGQCSGVLADQICAGLPVVANAHLAASLEAPSYVARVPDGLSPVLAAERLLALLERRDRLDHEKERASYVAGHSGDAYAESLLACLGLA